MGAAVCAAPRSEDRLIYLLSQAQQIQELLACLRRLSNSGLLQCVAAAATGGSCPVPHNDMLVSAKACWQYSCAVYNPDIEILQHCTVRTV